MTHHAPTLRDYIANTDRAQAAIANRERTKAMHKANVAAVLASVPGGYQDDVLFDLLAPRLDAMHRELLTDLRGLIDADWRDAPAAAEELLATANRIYLELNDD